MCKFLLKYCFSDLTLSTNATISTATAAALNGLPVLPMSDSSVTALRIFTDAQVKSIATVSEMGFSLSQTFLALSTANFNEGNACDLLFANSLPVAGAGGASNSTGTNNNVLLLLDEPQMAVFHLAAPVLLNREYVAPNEIDLLTHPSMQKYSNIRSFQAQFVPDLLRFILPDVYFNGTVLQSELDPKVFDTVSAFLKVFWKYASTRDDVISAVAQGASVVPAVVPGSVSTTSTTSTGSSGSNLRVFHSLSKLSNLIVRQKGDVVLPQVVLDIICALSVQLVDEGVLPEVKQFFFKLYI